MPDAGCPRCGTPNAAGARFCSSCGTALGAPPATNSGICRNCGMPRVANSRYCQNCGLDFEVRRMITMAILAIAVFLVIAYVLLSRYFGIG